MNNAHATRHRWVINKAYQLAAVKLVVWQVLITFACLLGVFALAPEQTSSVLKILLALTLACVVHGCIAVVASHRSAGPMYRLKNYLESISKGRIGQQIAFRQTDHFQDVGNTYNEMVLVLEKERQNDLRIIQQLEDGIEQLKMSAKDEATAQMAEYLHRLNNDLKNFKTR